MGKKLKKIYIIISCIILSILIIIVPSKKDENLDTDKYREIVISLTEEYGSDIEGIKKEILSNINKSDITNRYKGSYYIAYIVYNLLFLDFDEIKRISSKTEEILIQENMQVHLAYYYFYLAYMYSQSYDYTNAYININKANEVAGKLYEKYKDSYVIELLTSTKYLQASIEGDLELNYIAKKTFDEAEKLELTYNAHNYIDTINSKIKHYLYEKDYTKVIELALDLKNKIKNKENLEVTIFFNDMYLSEAYIKLGKIKDAELVLNKYHNKDLSKIKLPYKLRIDGLLEETKGNYSQSLEFRKKEYINLVDMKNYKAEMKSIEKIIYLCKKTGRKDEISSWNDKYTKVVEKNSNTKGAQYLIGSLGDIELQNIRYNNKILELESEKLAYIGMIIVIVSILIIIIIGIANRNKRIRNEVLSSDIDLLSKQLKNQYEHYNNIKEYQEEVRRLWHDMKHHTNLLNTLLEKGKYEECKKYLNSMSSTIDLNRSKAITNHSILDAILVNKEKLCKEKNIELLLDIKVPENLNIDNFDLCVIYKNLLDNAIEACLKLEDKERYISIKSMVMNKYLYIEILNSKSNHIIKSKGRFISSKTDGGIHGLGISSVKKSVEKYKGNIKFDYSDEWFKVTALLKNEIKQ